jgi:hypothetical protein
VARRFHFINAQAPGFTEAGARRGKAPRD